VTLLVILRSKATKNLLLPRAKFQQQILRFTQDDGEKNGQWG
jgi:hypothetical protein